MERLSVLRGHLSSPSSSAQVGLIAERTGAVRPLPAFDSAQLEKFIDDLSAFKHDIYDELKPHPELLRPIIEDLTKGQTWSTAPFDSTALLKTSSRAIQLGRAAHHFTRASI